ncbi:MAG: putative Ig domain-containing protein [Rhodocyclaceae bacterium]|nr:putative Ig domain-containing protein [Rhodocyclaceae bacterium]
MRDTLSYSAALANSKTLPAWLKFDAATQTFSGTAPAGAKGQY